MERLGWVVGVVRLLGVVSTALGCAASVQERRAATTMEALTAGKAIVVVSTSAETACRGHATYVLIWSRAGGRHGLVNLNNGYEQSDFQDQFGTFDAYVLDPGEYSLLKEVLSPNYEYTRPLIGTFRLHPGEMKYIGNVHGTGWCGILGGSLAVAMSDEWESVRPKLGARFPTLDASRVTVELFSPQPDVGRRSPQVSPVAVTSGDDVDAARVASNPPWDPERRPTWSLGIVWGLAAGGDDIANTSKDGENELLKGGTGINIGAAVHRGVFGDRRRALLIGLESGFKENGISGDGGSQATLTRVPVIPQVRYLHGASPGARLVVAAGPQLDLRVNLSQSGSTYTPYARLDNGLGAMVEAGFLAEGPTLGVGFSARVTYMRYGTPLGPVSGSSIGGVMTIQWSAFEER